MCDYRESREKWEWANLAPYASHASDPSLTWRRSEQDPELTEQPHPRPKTTHFPDGDSGDVPTADPQGSLSRFKTAFQIDKERVASSTAFRRLEYKTQMFVSHEGDHLRTRLTHTIEVDETAHFIAQALRLNEDLASAIALGHDLGHTPFGHAGEAALNQLFHRYWPKGKRPERVNGEKYGGAFYHNVQSVRVVDSLEKGYEWDRRPSSDKKNLHNPPGARGRGLDLTWAVREGILKHSSRGLKAGQLRMLGSDYLMAELDPFQPATLEGQVVEFADEIASIMHDLEDGLRSRIFAKKDLADVISRSIPDGSLVALLGLTPDFGHGAELQYGSRANKLRDLLQVIRKDDDCTNGTVLAFLRSLLISNLVEATHWRLVVSLGGNPAVFSDPVPKARHKASSNELIWIRVTRGKVPGPTKKSYCPEAWEIEPSDRQLFIQTFLRRGSQAEPTSKLERLTARVTWPIKSPDPRASQFVVLERQNDDTCAYPVGNVCITYEGAKTVGYHENLMELRERLRSEFIPSHLHQSSSVLRMNDKGQRLLSGLFDLYYKNPCVMHRSALERFDMWKDATGSPKRLRKLDAFVLRIVEHLQGMTDRYVNEEYTRLFSPGTHVTERDELSIVDGGKPPFEADHSDSSKKGAQV